MSLSQCFHLYNVNKNSTSQKVVIKMKRDNNAKHLEQCLAYYKDSVTIEYYCYEPLQE